MKRLIDLLTLLTLGLSILATSWSIDSFGQAQASTMETFRTLDLNKYEARYFQIHALSSSPAATPGSTLERDSQGKDNCQTFEFLEDSYFMNPEDHYLDPCLESQKPPKDHFRFMGDNYPELPEEKVELNFTY